MTKAFKASRLIGLLPLLAGFMAFGATAALAEPGAYWEVGGTKILEKGQLLTQINARKDSPYGIFLTTSGLSKIEILCTEIKFVNGLLHESGRATGKVHIDNCQTKLNGTVAGACKPHSPGDFEGLVETESLELLIALHEEGVGIKVGVVRVSPVNAEGIFVKLQLGTGSCSIGNNIPITGVGFMKDCTKEGLVNKVKHLFEEFKPLTKLLFGKNPATIDGSSWAFLQGSHEGQSWSGQPA